MRELRRLPAPFRYGLAVAAVVVVTGVKGALVPLIREESPFLLFFFAIFFAAWIGGRGPGLLATVLAAVSAWYFFFAPYFSATIGDAAQLIRIGIFLLEGSVITLIASAVEGARRRAESSAEELRENEEGLRFLASASRTLSSSLDYRETLKSVAQLAVPRLADWCAVDIVEEDGSLQRLAAEHEDPEKVEMARELQERYPPDPESEYGVHQVLRTGRPQLVAEIPESLLQEAARDEEHRALLTKLGLESYMIVPLVARGRTLGAISFIAAGSGRRYGQEDVALAEDLAARAAFAVDNARLYEAAQLEISERERAESKLAERMEELRRSNAELEQFAYVASHDLQEPLRMVSSFTQLLRRRYEGQLDETADEFIGYAVDGATRMQGLINALLEYSRVGTRGRPFAAVDTKGVFDAAVANLRNAIAECGAEVVSGKLPVVTGDEVQLMQLFQNLIANAVKFRGDERPRVRVEAQRQGHEWLFSVEDNGIGIGAEYRERIFVIFQRLHGREEYSGTGIGLALSKKIVERHGGKIWVESEPGRGSTFYFTLRPAG